MNSPLFNTATNNLAYMVILILVSKVFFGIDLGNTFQEATNQQTIFTVSTKSN